MAEEWGGGGWVKSGVANHSSAAKVGYASSPYSSTVRVEL